jgi:DNA-directed RNA polymerase subunit omega
MKLMEGFDSNYRYILVAARRARQLQSGAPPVVDTSSRKPCRIAQDEIRAGKVKWEIPELRSPAGARWLGIAHGQFASADLRSCCSDGFNRQLRVADWKCGPEFFAWSVTNP